MFGSVTNCSYTLLCWRPAKGAPGGWLLKHSILLSCFACFSSPGAAKLFRAALSISGARKTASGTIQPPSRLSQTEKVQHQQQQEQEQEDQQGKGQMLQEFAKGDLEAATGGGASRGIQEDLIRISNVAQQQKRLGSAELADGVFSRSSALAAEAAAAAEAASAAVRWLTPIPRAKEAGQQVSTQLDRSSGDRL